MYETGGFSQARQSTNDAKNNRMHLTKSARDDIHDRRKKRGQTVEAVSVHVMKLEDLPEPLTRREFREICQREGIPVSGGGIGIGKPTAGDYFDQCKDSQALRIQERWNNTVSNLFGAYLKVFDLFKSWHSSMIQQRHFGPQNVQEHVDSQRPMPPFKNPIKPNISKQESQHVVKQKQLVNLLIQYGIGLSMSELIADGNLNKNAAGGTFDSKLHSGQQTMRYPTPLGSHQYGPTVNKQMLFDQLASQTFQHFRPNEQNSKNLMIPNMMNYQTGSGGREQKHKAHRMSIAGASDNDSRNMQSAHDSSHGRAQILNDSSQELVRRDTDDYEHFDVQDEVQIAQNAAERLRLITAAPESILDRSVERKQQTVSNLKRDTSMMKFGDELLAGPTLTDRELNNSKELYTPLHLRLKQELLETREKLSQVSKQLESADKRNVTIISKYNKEEVDRAVLAKHLSMPYPEQAETLRSQIESKFVNVADGLEPHIVAILNTKLESIKAYFVGQIQLISHHTESLRQNVALMENINKDGIKFSEMDTENLIERIYQVEDLKRNQNAELRQLDPTSKHRKDMNRPQCIWNMLVKHFGQDYFLEVIEEEFGITPGANEIYASKIELHFQHSITAYKVEQHRMQREFDDQVKMLRDEVQELTEENTRLLKQNEKQQEYKMQELRKNQIAISQINEDALKKQYKALLMQRDDTIRELNHERDHYYRSQKGMQLNWAFKRLQMFKMVSALVKNVEEHKRTKIDNQMIKLCDKFMKEEFLIRRYSDEHDIPPQVAKVQILQEKLHKMRRKYEKSEANYGWHSNRAEFNAARIEEYRCKVEKLKNLNITLQLKIPQLTEKVEKFQETIRLKEKVVKELTESVTAIEKRWANQTKDPHKFTAKKILESLEVKSDNELSNFLAVNAMKNALRGHKNRTIGTITMHQNILIPFESKRMAEKADVCEQEVQAIPEMINNVTQFEVMTKDKASGKDRDFRLVSTQVQCDDATGKQYHEQKGLMRQNTFADMNQSKQASTTSNKNKTVKSSFGRPSMKKAQSTVLGSKEFQFNNASRMQNISSVLREGRGGADDLSQHDSANKMVRRQSVMNKASARKMMNAGSQNEQQSKDSKSIMRRQTTIVGKKSDVMQSDASPDSQDLKSKKSRLQRGKTTESVTYASRDGDGVAGNQNSHKKNMVRQTAAGASNTSMYASENFGNMINNTNNRQSQQLLQHDSDLNTNKEAAAIQQSSPVNNGHQSAMIKSPERLNISSNTKQHKNLLHNKSKEKLGMSKRQREATQRLTSAVVGRSPGKSSMGAGGNSIRNTLGKMQSKRELCNPSLLKTDAQNSQSKLGTKSKNQSSMVHSRKAGHNKLSSEYKDEQNKSTLTRQSVHHGGLATVRSNASSRKRSVSKNTNRHNKAAQLPPGAASQYGKMVAGSGMSPTSYMIVSGGEELPNLGQEQSAEYSSNNRVKGFPSVLVNSFGDVGRKVSSPQQDGTYRVHRDHQQDYTPAHLPHRERNTDQMPTENSAINLNFMEAKFGHDNNETKQQQYHRVNPLQSPGLVDERNTALQMQRPTTVQDTSKEYSPTHSRQMHVQSASASEHFSHLQKRYKAQSQSQDDENGKERDAEGDRYSSQSAHDEQETAQRSKVMLNQRRRAKNMSHQYEHHGEGILLNEDEQKRSSPNKMSALFFGSSVMAQGIDDTGDNLKKSRARIQLGENNMNDFDGGKRLTKVQEQEEELRVMSASGKKHKSKVQSMGGYSPNAGQQAAQQHTSNAKLAGKDKYLVLSMSSRKNSELHGNEASRSSSRSSKINHHNNFSVDQAAANTSKRLSIQQYKSFATDDDNSTYSQGGAGGGSYSKRKQQKERSSQKKPLNQICHMIEKQSHNWDVAQSNQTRIQKLLLKGYINEEQFICLQLLEKGYIPSSPDGYMQQQQAYTEQRRNEQLIQRNSSGKPSNNKRSKRRNIGNRFQSATAAGSGGVQFPTQHHGAQTISVNTASSGFYQTYQKQQGVYSSSNSRSVSRSHKRTGNRAVINEKTYRIYPKKIPELEKIYNRVYQKKREIGTQCDDQTTANVLMQGAVQQQEMNRKTLEGQQQQVMGRGTYQPNTKMTLHQKPKKISGNSQAKTARQFASRRNSKDVRTQAHSSSQYPFSTMNSVGEKTNAGMIETFGQTQPFVKSHLTLNTHQRSTEAFNEKNSAQSKWVNAIPIEKTESSQHYIHSHRRIQKVHKLNKNQREQARVLTGLSSQQRPNVMTSCSQRTAVNVAATTDIVHGGYKTNQGKTPHNLIVPAGHGPFIAHAINGRQTAPPKNSLLQGNNYPMEQQQQQLGQKNHPYLAQNVPKS